MDTDEDEHSIEMQLPYIAKVMEELVLSLMVNSSINRNHFFDQANNVILLVTALKIRLLLSRFLLDLLVLSGKLCMEDCWHLTWLILKRYLLFPQTSVTGVNGFVILIMTDLVVLFINLLKTLIRWLELISTYFSDKYLHLIKYN